MERKNWFITGASSGLGLAVCRKALENGDFVAAAGLAPIDDLKALQNQYPDTLKIIEPDVTDRQKVFATIDALMNDIKTIDVVYSAAGFLVTGSFENTPDKLLRAEMEVNFFGSVNVAQAIIPYMRKQRQGLYMQMTSGAGIVTIPFNGTYSASKYAVEGYFDALAQEIQGYNVKIMTIQAGAFNTGLEKNRKDPDPSLIGEAYKEKYDAFMSFVEKADQFGESADEAAKQIVRAATDVHLPRLLNLGNGQYDHFEHVYKQRLEEWAK